MAQKVFDFEFLTDIICLFTLFCFNIFLTAYASVTKAGFDCNDLSIRYPYVQNEKKEPFRLAEVYLLPILMAWTCEAVVFSWKDPNPKKMKLFFLLYDSFISFTFGYLLSTALAVFLQKSTGVLRPHFISVCIPDIDCTSLDNQNKYITNYTCTAKDQTKVDYARLSFPSCYCLQVIFSTFLLVLVLEAKVNIDGVNLLKRLIQSFILLYGHIQCVLRFRDYENHWTDILVGYIMGAGFAYYNVGRLKSEEMIPEHNFSEKSQFTQISLSKSPTPV